MSFIDHLEELRGHIIRSLLVIIVMAVLVFLKIDWVFDVGDGVFLHPGAERRAALVFAVTPSKILAFTKAPYSQTRYVM